MREGNISETSVELVKIKLKKGTRKRALTDWVQRFLNEKPFMVFVLSAGQTSIPVGALRAFISRMLFSSQCKVVTPSLMINNIMEILVQHWVIPTDYHDVYTLGYGCVGLLQGSLMIVSLGAGPLSHFYLRSSCL